MKNMVRANKSDLREDKCLAEVIQRYPCLYDKNDKGYRDMACVNSAWRNLEQELGYEEG